jgi:hypothetical protein
MTHSYTGELQVFLKQTSASECARSDRPDLSESEAIRRAQREDADGFEHIYQSYSGRVYALCLRMEGNTAAKLCRKSHAKLSMRVISAGRPGNSVASICAWPDPSTACIWNAQSDGWRHATKWLSSFMTFRATSKKKLLKSWIGPSAIQKPTCTARAGGSVISYRSASI